MISKTLASIAILLVLSQSCLAFEAIIKIEDSPNEIMGGGTVLSIESKTKYDFKSRIVRLQIANKLLSTINKLDNLIPNLTQSRREKLDAQYEKIKKPYTSFSQDEFSQRMHDTAEYEDNPDLPQQILEDLIEHTQENLNCIINAQNIKKEMYCWTELSMELMDQTLWKDNIEILVKKNPFLDVVFWPTMVDEPNIQLSYKIFRIYGLNIINKIVLPYIASPESFSMSITTDQNSY